MTTISQQIAELEADLNPAPITAALKAGKLDLAKEHAGRKGIAELLLPDLRIALVAEQRDARKAPSIAARAARVAAAEADREAAAARVKNAGADLKAATEAHAVLHALVPNIVSADYLVQCLDAKATADRQCATVAGETIEADAEWQAWSEARQLARWAVGDGAPFEPRMKARLQRLNITADTDDLAIAEALPLDQAARDRVIYLVICEGLRFFDIADQDSEAA